ncbi:hypothetical protein GUITHDRAFT_103509 [Guillardia theta CCMP2712]|uniref:Uncharacterized protein n=1 Tax=Guillardia theta (strain CCMP2712) TaxID=905079 RepID=L1JS69_GUITC|nr:hypothetical protein GUITHDRAFT_103509 [Guillardia theta CCMP2712]EKX50928.1 hypothetical protein GUITHDRAFT_103509 [Guillardia theta CCMP2712]|eukprot:XP_005837908.1 hypothetical protein GUITHDRAFT_103509 [Guillardia theta CCMP2712]
MKRSPINHDAAGGSEESWIKMAQSFASVGGSTVQTAPAPQHQQAPPAKSADALKFALPIPPPLSQADDAAAEDALHGSNSPAAQESPGQLSVPANSSGPPAPSTPPTAENRVQRSMNSKEDEAMEEASSSPPPPPPPAPVPGPEDAGGPPTGEKTSEEVWSSLVNFASGLWQDLKMPSQGIEGGDELVADSKSSGQVQATYTKDVESYVEEHVVWTEINDKDPGESALVAGVSKGLGGGQIRPMEIVEQSAVMAKPEQEPEQLVGVRSKLGASAPAEQKLESREDKNQTLPEGKDAKKQQESQAKGKKADTDKVEDSSDKNEGVPLALEHVGEQASEHDVKHNGGDDLKSKKDSSQKTTKKKTGCFPSFSLFRKKAKEAVREIEVVEEEPVRGFPYIRILMEFGSQVPRNSLTADETSERVAQVIGAGAGNVMACRHLKSGVVAEILVKKGVCGGMTSLEALQLLEKKVKTGDKTLGNEVFEDLLYNVVTWPAIIDASVRVQEIQVENGQELDTQYARADFFFDMDFQEVYGVEQDIMGDLHDTIVLALSADANKLWVAGLRPTSNLVEMVLERGEAGKLAMSEVVEKLSRVVPDGARKEEQEQEDQTFKECKRVVCWESNSMGFFEKARRSPEDSAKEPVDVGGMSEGLVLSQDKNIQIDEFDEEAQLDEEESPRPPEKKSATDVWDGRRWLKMRDSFILNGRWERRLAEDSKEFFYNDELGLLTTSLPKSRAIYFYEKGKAFYARKEFHYALANFRLSRKEQDQLVAAAKEEPMCFAQAVQARAKCRWLDRYMQNCLSLTTEAEQERQHAILYNKGVTFLCANNPLRAREIFKELEASAGLDYRELRQLLKELDSDKFNRAQKKPV